MVPRTRGNRRPVRENSHLRLSPAQRTRERLNVYSMVRVFWALDATDGGGTIGERRSVAVDGRPTAALIRPIMAKFVWQRVLGGDVEYLEGRHVDNSSFETVSLGDYFGVVWRRKWIVLLVTILFGVAGFLYRHAPDRRCCLDLFGCLQPADDGLAAAQKSISADTWGSTPGQPRRHAVFAQTVHVLERQEPDEGLHRAAAVERDHDRRDSAGQRAACSRRPTRARLDAQTIANGFANQYPVYLRDITQNSDLNKDLRARG